MVVTSEALIEALITLYSYAVNKSKPHNNVYIMWYHDRFVATCTKRHCENSKQS